MSEHQKGGSSVAGMEKMFGTVVGDEVRDNGGKGSKSWRTLAFIVMTQGVIRGFGAKIIRINLKVKGISLAFV